MNRAWVLLIAVICLLGVAGCGEPLQEAENSETPIIQPTNTVTSAATAKPTHSAAPKPADTPSPAATLPPGIREEAKYYADLDGDGEDEMIVISSVDNDNPENNDNISLGVLSKKAYREVHIQEGFFNSAMLTRTKSGEVCLLIDCYDHAGISKYTTVCSFNGLMPVLHDSLYSWIVHVDGTTVTLGACADFIGSWNYTCKYTLADSFELIRISDMMITMENCEPLHTIRELPVEMLVDGKYVADTVPAGTFIWPVSSEGEGCMTFRLEGGKVGRITYIRNEEYEAVIDGVSESEYFDNVNYWD